MTTLREQPKSELGKRLQASRTNRPDEWSMDEYTRMAEDLQKKLEAAEAKLKKAEDDVYALTWDISVMEYNNKLKVGEE